MQPIMAPPVQEHLIRRDSAWLKSALLRWKKVLPFVDTLTIVDPDGRVIARYNSSRHGDLFGIPEIVRQMYLEKKAVVSNELVNSEFLRKEEDPAGTDTEAMVVLVAIPLIAPDGSLLGGVIAGDKINNDPYLPFKIQEIFDEDAEVAVSMRGMRIASNHSEDNSQNGIVEPHILQRLQKGYSYRGRAEIDHREYETVFEPLTNSRGDFVGSLSVALSKEKMQKIRVDNLRSILISAVVGIFLSFVIAFIAARRFSGPILELANGARQIEMGDLNQRVVVRNHDEVGELAGSFNRMVNALAERDSIISRKNKDLQELNELLEKKVTLRTAELSMEMGRLETILTSMVEGVLVTDGDSRVILFNPAAQAILDLVPYKVIGQPIEQLHNISGEFTHLVSCIRDIKENWGPVPSRQEDMTLKGKKLKVNLAPMAREGNQFAGIVMSLRDITAEEEIDRMKTEFISTVSHELKTPLTSMKGSLQLLLNRGKWFTNTERQLLSVCLRNTQRLIRMISEILDISRMESGGMEFTFKPLSMGELVVYAVEEIKTFAQSRNISIINSLGDHLPLVFGDYDRLIQVLTNLLSNAVKFSPEGKIVMVLAEQDGNYLTVSVTDRAKAIQWSDREKLFKKFQQFESDQPMQGGTGLGLAICKEIIEKHHGKIFYNAGKEGGNVFSFTIPVYEEHHAN
jgi:PAS domain S-box-containing protein